MSNSLPVKKTVNLKAVLILMGVLVLFGGAVYGVHAFQIQRNAEVLRDQAKLLQDEGKKMEALGFWNQYVGMVPEDIDALARHAKLFEELTRTKPLARQKAFYKLDNVLHHDPQRADIRLLAARVALQLRRYADAKTHLTILMEAKPADTTLINLMAYCAVGEQQNEEAAKWFRKALDLDTHNIDLFLGLAILMREKLDQTFTADQQIDAMIEANKDSQAAWMEAARYYYRYKDWDKAEKHLSHAMKDLKVQTAEAFFLAADVARSQNKVEDSRKSYQEGLVLHPKDTRLNLGMARLEGETGHPEKKMKITENMLKDLRERQPSKTNEYTTLAEDYDLAILLLDQPEKAREMIKRFTDKGAKIPAEFLEGRLAMIEKAWGKARAHMEYVRMRRETPPDFKRRANLFLAECFKRLGSLDQALEACHRSLEGNPNWLEGRRALAVCLAAMGRTELAIVQFKKLAAEKTPGARLELARLLLIQNLSKLPADQDWASVERELNDIPPGQPGEVAAQLLRAEMLVAQQKYDEARTIAEAQLKRNPKQFAPWMFLINLSQIRGDTEATKHLLDEAEKHTRKQAEWTLSGLRLSFRFDKPAEIKKDLAKIEQELSTYLDEDRAKVLFGLADAYMLLGDRENAIRLWDLNAKRLPYDIHVRFRLLEAALGASHMEEARRWVEDIKRVEGPEGPMGFYGEAWMMVRGAEITKAAGGDATAQLAKARERLAKVAALRSSWSRVPLLEGFIFELENQKDKALEKYEAAQKLGDTHPKVLRRMLQLLYDKGRYPEAHALMSKLPEEMLENSGLRRVKAELDLLGNKDGDPAEARARALDTARKAVKQSSAEYQDWVWLGLMAGAAGQAEEAETALRKARDLKRDAPNAWAALISHLARTDQQKAEIEILNAKRELKDKSPLVVAAGYEILGKINEAETNYKLALDASPTDLTLLRNAAGFYRRTGQPAKAEALLRKLLAPATGAPEAALAWARRNLALILAASGKNSRFQEALNLLAENHKQLGDTEDDKRTTALVMASQPSKRRQAIEMFERLRADRTASPDSRFLLAQLYEADGKWDMAKIHLQQLVRDHENNAIYLARLVFLLLRHNESDAALKNVKQLVKLVPNKLETVTLHSQALKAAGQSFEAVNVVQAFARTGEAPLDQIGYLFEQLGQKSEAEERFRKYAATSEHPEAKLTLAAFLARADKTTEALDICEKSWQTCKPEAVAITSVTVLRAGHATEAQGQQVEKRLRQAMEKNPGKRGFKQLLAEFHDYYGRDDKSMALYHELLQGDPNSVSALNNLAGLLALKGNGNEALPLIEKAIQIHGQQPQLLDTRAMVYLSLRQGEQALRDVDDAINMAPEPLFYFHKARAMQMRRDMGEARKWLAQAKKDGLTAATLPRLEQPVYQSMEKELNDS